MLGYQYGGIEANKYGFNGKEQDSPGIGGGGNTYDYGFRIYSSNVARFLNVRSLYGVYPW